jgi:hypothetical protein
MQLLFRQVALASLALAAPCPHPAEALSSEQEPSGLVPKTHGPPHPAKATPTNNTRDKDSTSKRYPEGKSIDFYPRAGFFSIIVPIPVSVRSSRRMA